MARIKRIPIRITTKVTKSGRRFHYSAFIAVGNEKNLSFARKLFKQIKSKLPCKTKIIYEKAS